MISSITTFRYSVRKRCATFLLALFLTSTFSIHLFAQQYNERYSGLWLNNVPGVVDSSASRIYFTLTPKAPYRLTTTLKWNDSIYSTVALDNKVLTPGSDNFAIDDWHQADAHQLLLTDKTGNKRTWTLVFTNLSLLVFDTDYDAVVKMHAIDANAKVPGFITVIDAQGRTDSSLISFSSPMAIRIHGVTSAGKPKKSFAIELKDEHGEERDAGLLGYRNDDDWLIDAMFNDHARMRNRLLTDLWNAVEDLPYDKDNNYQRNGTDGEYVEVIMNGKWQGLYCFTDKIDRKKLNLKKTKDATDSTSAEVRGLLWKGRFMSSAVSLYNYDALPKNDTLVWEHWEQKYPDDAVSLICFDPIVHLIDIVGKSASAAVFEAKLDSVIYMKNVIDYIIFSNAFTLADNQLKNTYLSVRNKNKTTQLLITPWDMDATLGRSAGGDEVINDPKWWAFGEQIGGLCGLSWRLVHKNPNNFHTLFHDRWNKLKEGPLALDSVKARMMKYADLFTNSGAWQREYALWSKKMPKSIYEEVDYIMDYLKKNYSVFDDYIKDWPLTPEGISMLQGDDSQLHLSVCISKGSLSVRSLDAEALAGHATVSVCTSDGKEVSHSQILPFSLSHLMPGVYIVQLKAFDGRRATEKIIIP